MWICVFGVLLQTYTQLQTFKINMPEIDTSNKWINETN